MKLKHGKRYETADGVVYKVRHNPAIGNVWDVSDDTREHWDESGKGFYDHPDLIRRHYRKPQPAHKLDLNPGDMVELVMWEDGAKAAIGKKITCGKDGNPVHGFFELNNWDKGQRPLFRVVSRA